MNILHVTCVGKDIENNGVSQVTRKFLEYQNKVAVAYLINIIETKMFTHERFFQFDKKKTIDFIFDKNISLVIFHGIYYPAYLYISSRIKNKVPYLIVPHGSLTREAQKSKFLKKKIANALLFKSFIKGAQSLHYLTTSESERSIVEREHFIIPNGVETKGFFEKKDTENIDIVFIGRKNIYIKGLDYLLEEVATVRKKLQRTTVHLYGPDRGGSKKYIADFIRKYQLHDIVFNHDEIHGAAKVELFQNAAATILTSRTEGHPTALTESLSHSTPILASVNSGMKEYIDKWRCGWSFAFKKGELAEILQEIDKNGINPNIYRNSYACAVNEFDWGQVTRSTIKEYQEILLSWKIHLF